MSVTKVLFRESAREQDDSVRLFESVLTLCDKLGGRNEDDGGNNKLSKELKKLTDLLGVYQDQVCRISSFSPQYDSATGVRANGYRSFVRIAGTFIGNLTEFLVDLHAKHRHVTASDYDALASYLCCLERLVELNEFLIELESLSSGTNELIPNVDDLRTSQNEALARRMATADFSAFYGRHCGFHMKGDCRRLAFPLVFALANFADITEGSYASRLRRLCSSVLGLRYLWNPDALGRRVCGIVRERQVDFVKFFFNTNEIDGINAPFTGEGLFKDPDIKANCIIKIPPKRLSVGTTTGSVFEVPIPSSHIGSKHSLSVRLISPFRTQEMMGNCDACQGRFFSTTCDCPMALESDAILFHMHGGGFVSQTSKSHQSYLKMWAKQLGVPILSVDYSVAPEAPYPRAVEEVLFAYCWMLNNFSLLGATGRRVVVGGDSAGSNLAIGLTLQCIQMSLPKPDAIMAIYPALLCSMQPSPSRMVCLIDPLVMFPSLLRCLNCYADPDYTKSCPRTYEEEIENCKGLFGLTDPLLSPLLASHDMIHALPPTHIISTDIDPCLDESIAFSNKLVKAGVRVKIDVLTGLPHGFLSLNAVSKDCMSATEFVTEKLRDLVLSQ